MWKQIEKITGKFLWTNYIIKDLKTIQTRAKIIEGCARRLKEKLNFNLILQDFVSCFAESYLQPMTFSVVYVWATSNAISSKLVYLSFITEATNLSSWFENENAMHREVSHEEMKRIRIERVWKKSKFKQKRLCFYISSLFPSFPT